MKQEDKDLLLRDLCARLPYEVKGVEANTLCSLNTVTHFKSIVKNIEYKIEHLGFKPYLFPISSMTEEQKRESPFESSLLNAFINGYISLFEDEELTIDDLNGLYDWFNKNHFDYRGLIPMGLANDATNLNIY